jgi:hypothetical protein
VKDGKISSKRFFDRQNQNLLDFTIEIWRVVTTRIRLRQLRIRTPQPPDGNNEMMVSPERKLSSKNHL